MGFAELHYILRRREGNGDTLLLIPCVREAAHSLRGRFWHLADINLDAEHIRCLG
jgi:hypothetical protein